MLVKSILFFTELLISTFIWLFYNNSSFQLFVVKLRFCYQQAMMKCFLSRASFLIFMKTFVYFMAIVWILQCYLTRLCCSRRDTIWVCEFVGNKWGETELGRVSFLIEFTLFLISLSVCLDFKKYSETWSLTGQWLFIQTSSTNTPQRTQKL